MEASPCAFAIASTKRFPLQLTKLLLMAPYRSWIAQQPETPPKATGWPSQQIFRSLTMLNHRPERLPYREPFRWGFP
jgi:hypothetical protein